MRVGMEKDIKKRYDKSFYKMMAENFGDEIFVTDGDGMVLFVNLEAAKVIERPVNEIVGRHVTDLVEEGFFRPSSTVEALRQRKTVNIIQELNNGKKVLCTSVPVFDDMQEKIRMVISTTKDVDELQEILDTVKKQNEELENLRDITFEEAGLIAGTDKRNNIRELIARIAPLDIPVLIQGETGVGKEVAARSIHQLSRGKNKPMVKINCGIIPENLIESELFGYEPGAFTGAEKSGKRGKVEMAEGGTLFLDEIGEMPLSLQVKLLDFLQDGSFTRVGGTERHKVSTRVITATNRDLKEMCREGSFRMDLYYRINVVPLNIPPLRERHDDIDALAKHFLTGCNEKYHRRKTFSDKAKEAMHCYDWPGNIREMEHVIEHVYILSFGEIITEKDVNEALYGFNSEKNNQKVVLKGIIPLKEAKNEIERQLVTQAYSQYGSTYKAAEALQCDQSTVAKILKKYGSQ
jgi:transcriptional regulator with PAS, ATPase and Fis domain